MNTMRLIVAAVLAAVLYGCTHCVCIDVSNGDRYGYSIWTWSSRMSTVCADLEARARYYGWGARTQYGTNVWHRIEVIMYDEGPNISQTNILKRARYWVRGEKAARDD